VAFFLLPNSLRLVTRLLISWDVFVAFYLVLVYTLVFGSGLAHIRRNAVLQDDGRFLILLVTATGAFASIAAIIFELDGTHRGTPELALATVTIALSWAAVHTTFALHYAHEFYRGAKPGGLQFPSGDQHEDADYWDFVYFSFVIGMTRASLRRRHHRQDHPPHRDRARHHLVHIQHRAAGADGQYRRQCDLSAPRPKRAWSGPANPGISIARRFGC